MIKVRPGFTFTCRIVSLKKEYRKLLIKRPGLNKVLKNKSWKHPDPPNPPVTTGRYFEQNKKNDFCEQF